MQYAVLMNDEIVISDGGVPLVGVKEMMMEGDIIVIINIEEEIIIV